jgi:hypothetical protein
MSMSADGWHALRSVARRGMASAGALALSRLIGGMLYGVSSNDPVVHGGSSLIFALVALVAC